MSGVTLSFLAVGGLSLLLLLLSLRLRRIGHLRFPHGLRRTPGQAFTLPATSGFVGGFGFGGAIAVELSGRTGPSAVLAGSLAGVVAGTALAWLAGRFVRAVADMPTDATPHSAGLVGATGVVVSEIPPRRSRSSRSAGRPR